MRLIDARSRSIARVIIVAAAAAAAVLVFGAAGRVVGGRLGDFTHFYAAAQAARGGGDLYTSGDGGYIYPPLLAFLFQPLTALEAAGAAMLWLALNAALLGVGIGVASREAVRRWGMPGVPWPLVVVAAATLLLTLDKTRATLNQAQTDCMIVLGFALGLRWLERRPMLAGMALGLAANVKYLSLIALPYLIIRRRWSAAAWTMGWTVAWALLPAASLGWSGNLAALRHAGAGLLGAVGVSVPAEAANVHAADWHLSLSVTSAVSRLFGAEVSTAIKLAASAGVGLAVLAVVWAIYARRGRPLLRLPRPGSDPRAEAVTALEWAGLVIASLAFGPQTTGRHLVLLLTVHPLVVAILLAPGFSRRRFSLVAAVVLFQLAMALPPGGRAFESAVDAWRAVGGASWCMLAMYLAMLWVGLPEACTAANPFDVTGIQPSTHKASEESPE